jgi:hypothetical protein
MKLTIYLHSPADWLITKKALAKKESKLIKSKISKAVPVTGCGGL